MKQKLFSTPSYIFNLINECPNHNKKYITRASGHQELSPLAKINVKTVSVEYDHCMIGN